ncbi:MAG TPA: hypothetical protein VFP69_20110, partial [Streptomyces sp.]|nr:hypothetical protein [Streptomyces sp.]
TTPGTGPDAAPPAPPETIRPAAPGADTPRLPGFPSPGTGHPPPPPKASARFPDAPPAVDGPVPARGTAPNHPTAARDTAAAPGRPPAPEPLPVSPAGDAGRSAAPTVPPGRAPARRPVPPAEGVDPSAAPASSAEGARHPALPPRPPGRPAPSAAPGRPGVPPRPAGRPPAPPQPPFAPRTPSGPRQGPPAAHPRPASAPSGDRAPHTAAFRTPDDDRGTPPVQPFPAPGGSRPGAARHGRGGTAGSPGRHPGTPPAPPSAPTPAWNGPASAPAGGTGPRPVVSFGRPEGYDELARPRPLGAPRRSRTAAAAACLVLGLGLIGGAVTGTWLADGSGNKDAREAYEAAGSLWRSVPVDRLFPPTVNGRGAGPGGADRTWTRIAVAPDGGCREAFDPLLRKALAPVGCGRLLRATYTDATRSHVTTVGMLFTDADAADMTTLTDRFRKDGLDRRTDLMPLPYAAPGTLAEAFGAEQRASWRISVLTDAPVVVFAVSGWADGRSVDEPLPAEEAMKTGTTASVAQAGLGHEARGLADRVERSLRKTVGGDPEQPS